MASSAAPAFSARVSETAFFTERARRIAYEDSGGDGHAIVCIPGLGDTRAQFRFLAPKLIAAGYRVIVIDPPGQGQSDAGWESYRPEHIGARVQALIHHLGLQDITLVGHSRGAAIASWTAAELPQTVSRLVLIGPFVRDVPIGFLQTLMLRLGFAGPWATALWGSYYAGLYPSTPPADLPAYIAYLKENLREPGRLDALRSMLFEADNAAVERRLPEVRAATLVLMGEQDKDFDNPATEAALVARLVRGEYAMLAKTSHYPHAERPEETFTLMHRFIHAPKDR